MELKTLQETLNEIIGDEAKAEEVEKSLAQYFVSKDAYKKVSEKRDEYKRIIDENTKTIKEQDVKIYELESEHLSEAEKMQKRIEFLEKEQKEANLKNNRAKAEAKLAKAGITDEDEVSKFIRDFVTEDEVETMRKLDTILEYTGKKVSAVEQTVTERLLQETSQVIDGDKAEVTDQTTISLETFKAMSIKEKNELFNTDRETYTSLQSQLTK